MALIVTGDFQTPYGDTVQNSYWRWVGLGVDVSTSTANCTLYGYISSDAFAEKKANIGQKSYVISGEDFGTLATALETGSSLSPTIYAYVQAHDEFFTGATDTEAAE